MDAQEYIGYAKRLEEAFGQVVGVVTEMALKGIEPHVDRMIELLREARNLLDEAEEWQPDTTAAKFVGLIERIDEELAKE